VSEPLESRLADRLLADRLLAIADELTEQVLAEMYKDPFWYARFGEPRASRHGRQDGNFHLSYVAEALHSGDAGVMERYARWLQQVLTTRGMCSRHLAENFDRLGRVITEHRVPDAQRAVELLAAATAALRYDGGPARALQDRADAIAGGDAELLTLVSYLADAVARDRPALFAGHVGWYAGFVEQQGEPRAGAVARAQALIDRLREAVLRELPEHREAVAPALDAAIDAVREPR
jgi:hypothetical protein